MDPVVLALIVVVISLLTPVLATLLVIRRLRHSNRVSPQVPTFAPMVWLWIPHRAARLHRRLRRLSAVARAAGRSTLPSMPDLVGDLERRACATDSKLVLAARMTGPPSWSMMNEVESEIRDLEALATRMVAMSTTWSSTSVGTEAIAERLDALEQAMREVDEIASPQPPPLRRLS